VSARRQRGQTLVLFAVMAVFIVGAVALTVDFGFLATQHRNLQAFADSAAIAGAQQLTPSGTSSQLADTQAAARKTAFFYIRDNLLCAGVPAGSCAAAAQLSAANLATACPPPAGITMWYADLQGCQMPAPLSSYTLTVCTPGQVGGAATCAAGSATGQAANTLSVFITESVATSLSRIVGAAGANAGGFAQAQYTYQTGAPYGRLPYALYSAGCVSTGNKPEIIAGDVYIDSCGLMPQSSGQAGFCAENTLGSAGNIVYGPSAPAPPANWLSNQTLVTCQAVSGGLALATGQVSQLPAGAGVPVPTFIPPPGFSAVDPTQTASAATANTDCVNGEVAADGSTLTKSCFTPGVYTTITGIANNLNPGVYYVLGDPTCDADRSTSTCSGVQFSDNTMNANWNNVADSCWAAPNNAAAGVFVSPCPSGFAFDPTSVADPMCPGGAPSGYAAPVFTLTATTDALGQLDSPPSGVGTRYYVRVTAVNAFGESTSTEQSVLVNGAPPLPQHGITVGITPQAGAKYNIYLSTTSGAEVLWNTSAPTSSLSVLVDTLGSGHAYPRFDTSRCHGFHNIPKWPNDAAQNYGVSFVLYNKAQFCVGVCGSSSQKPTVLHSPYCGGFKLSPPAACPYATSGPNLNDGAFAIYSSSTGQLSGQGAGTEMALTGTLYAPRMDVSFSSNALIEIIPGQVVAHSFSFQSGNALSPSIDFPYGQGYGGQGAQFAPLVSLVR
jgi:hypothetical protein